MSGGQTLDECITVDVAIENWGLVQTDHLQFVCLQGMVGDIFTDVIPNQLWSVFE